MHPKQGFSLVEVTFALGLVAFALLAILGLMPVGIKSGGEAVDATRTSFIGQDAQSRLRASVTYPMFAAAGDVNSTWFYDRDGIFLGQNVGPSAIYRADATIHGTWKSGAPPPTLDATVLRPVTLQIQWPVNTSTGAVLGKNATSFAFFVRRP